MADRVGQQLGNYRITQSLGRGGFAEVYLGEHIYLKTFAAVKILYTRLSISDDMESFIKEAQTVAQLAHPNIVRVLDFGVANETPFLVMDYAPKGTLRQRHPRNTQLAPSTLLPYVKQIADSLQYAHDERFIHRDVKPENMLIGKRNEILLSDFGIALVAQSSRNQSTQDVTGTVSYMAPEQIQGKPRPASDQYSLGITVYEWLAGSPPFKGSFTELCVQHMYAEVPPLREKVPTISPDIEQVVMTALAKDPKQRFGSITAFANALEQASGQRTAATPRIPSTPLPDATPPPKAAINIAPPPTRPAQNIPTPQPIPARLANAASIQEASDTANGRAYTEPPIVKQTTAPHVEKRKSVWAFGRKQIIGSIVGLVITIGITNYISNQINILGGYLYLSLLISIFFGILYGPWIGFIVGGASIIDNFIFHSYYGYYSLIFPAVSAAMGFIAGFAKLSTRGIYYTWGRAFIGGIYGALSFLIVTGVALTFFGGWGQFLEITWLNVVICLTIIPLFLFIYGRIFQRNASAV